MVRAGRAAAPQGPRLPGALRGRLRHGLCLRGRRPARTGRAAEAVRQVRSDDPPGQDAAGAVRTAAASTPGGGLWGRTSAGVIRLPGVPALLEPVEGGILGGAAEDGRSPVPSGSLEDCRLVPAEPSCA